MADISILEQLRAEAHGDEVEMRPPPSRQLHDALTEAGAMPQWELVATAQFLDQPETLRLPVDGGHLYVHGNAMAFASMGQRLAEAKHRLRTAIAKALTLESERDEARRKLAEMTADRDRAQHGYEQEHLLRHDALGQLGQEQRSREQAESRCEELRAESDTLKRKNAELRRQVDDWEAEAHKAWVGHGSMVRLACTGRAPAEVGPSSFRMRGCRLDEGHSGPCEA